MIKIVEAFGELKPGDTFEFTVPSANARYWGSRLEVGRGRVIAVDQDGHPAIVLSSLGAGKTLLSAYPLESWLAVTPSAFDKKPPATQLTDRLYRAVREGSRARPPFVTDHPSIEATTLNGAARGYVVLVNHGGERRTVTVTSSSPLTSVKQLRPDGATRGAELTPDGAQWSTAIDPFEGAVVEFRR